ncbi:MAG: hypothetical protein ABH824_07675 [Nanoarchaeota archaeon]|nr:hypothetical protein [Nanoarchaeota archaeon]MBU1631640.1 hypothetical protein [Nanoarchaeota archaeon]MBU1875653.1 hypothetical protein [Nanoarchaeota archaeon]
MDNPQLDQYTNKIVKKLKGTGYKDDDIKESFNRSFLKSVKQNKIFLFFCYISALIFGILGISIIIVGSSIFGHGIFFYVLAFLFLSLIALLTYFCFNNFYQKEKYLLITMLPLSLLLSATAFLIHILFRELIINTIKLKLLPQMTQQGQFVDMLSLFGEPLNIIVLIILILLVYNTLPIIFLIKKSFNNQT